MRVAMFSDSYDPIRNGVTTSVQTLSAELRRAGSHVYTVAPRHAGYRERSPLVLRAPSMRTFLNPSYPITFPWRPGDPRRYGRLRPDVIHSHNPFFMGLLAARVAGGLGVPLISTYHTLYDHYCHYVPFLPTGLALGLLRWWLPLHLNASTHIITPSAVTERSLRSFGVARPVSVVPTGTALPDPARIGPEARRAARERFRIPEAAPFLLYVGRVAREKSVETALRAFDQIAAALPGARLVLAGGGPYLDECRRIAAGLDSRAAITFAGPIEHGELTPIYAAADLFLFASTTETQGLVMAEARAAGTPCVIARGGGASETVRDGEDGLVTAPDAGAMATAALTLLRQPERLAAFSAACLRSAPDHTPAAMARRVLAIYDEAREETRRTSGGARQ